MVNVSDLTEDMIAALAFSKEEKEALDRAREMRIVFDKDCPETTPERALQFRRVNPPRGQRERMV